MIIIATTLLLFIFFVFYFFIKAKIIKIKNKIKSINSNLFFINKRKDELLNSFLDIIADEHKTTKYEYLFRLKSILYENYCYNMISNMHETDYSEKVLSHLVSDEKLSNVIACNIDDKKSSLLKSMHEDILSNKNDLQTQEEKIYKLNHKNEQLSIFQYYFVNFYTLIAFIIFVFFYKFY